MKYNSLLTTEKHYSYNIALGIIFAKDGARLAIRTPNVLKENPDLQSGAANRICLSCIIKTGGRQSNRTIIQKEPRFSKPAASPSAVPSKTKKQNDLFQSTLQTNLFL